MNQIAFAVIFCFASGICAAVGILAWQKRRMQGVTFFALTMLAVSIWAAASAAEQVSSSVAGKILSSKFQYIGITSLAPLWLLFVLDYTRQTLWNHEKFRLALAIIPLVTLLAAFTNEHHLLIWPSVTPISPNPGSPVVYEHGILFWTHAIYSYGLLLWSAIALIRSIYMYPALYQRQAFYLLLGLLLPWIMNIAYTVARINPGTDITPVGFALSGVIYAVSVFRFQLLNVAPIARHTLVDSLGDSVIVLDRQSIVADLNRTALKWSGVQFDNAIGKPAGEVFANWPELVQNYGDTFETCDEISIKMHDGTPIICEIQISPIKNRQMEIDGRVIVLRDITGRKKIEDENTRQRLELLIVNQLSLAVASQLELGRLIKLAGDQVSKTFDVDGVFIALVDRENDMISFPYWQTQGVLFDEPAMPYGSGLTSRLLRTCKPLVISHGSAEELKKWGALPSRSDHGQDPTRSWMGVPIMVGANAIGALAAFSYTQENAFNDADLHLMTTLAANLGIAIENAKLYEKAQAEIARRSTAEVSLRDSNSLLQAQLDKVEALQAELREQAIRDPLTGLFNRRYMEETLQRELTQANRENNPVSVLIMDIDKFKNVNDAYGHKTGDNMLKALSAMLMRNIRGSDVVCRYGGEEFVVIFNGTNLETAVKRAERLRKDFQELAISHEGQPVSATISIGVATYPAHASTGEGILIKADQALYVAKQSGRNKVVASK